MTESVKAVPRFFAFMPAAGTRELYGFLPSRSRMPDSRGTFFHGLRQSFLFRSDACNIL